jgi:excisionase family DNA binding protein
MPMAGKAVHVLTVSEVAAHLRVDRKVVYELIRNGQLSALKLGRALRVTREALGEFKAGDRARSA